jgi:hypothetical protein
MTESDKARLNQHNETRVMVEGRAAFARADAWARSAKGTPYGGANPVAEVKDQSLAPEPLDPRVMARLHGTEVKRG